MQQAVTQLGNIGNDSQIMMTFKQKGELAYKPVLKKYR